MSFTQLTHAAKGLIDVGMISGSAGIWGLAATAAITVGTIVAKGLDNAITSTKEHLENIK